MSLQAKEKIKALRAYSEKYFQLKVTTKVSAWNMCGMTLANLDTIRMSAGNFD
jgi:hypothetical protein